MLKAGADPTAPSIRDGKEILAYHAKEPFEGGMLVRCQVKSFREVRGERADLHDTGVDEGHARPRRLFCWRQFITGWLYPTTTLLLWVCLVGWVG